MERTNSKLNEAKFFLEMLQINNEKYPEFDYYLNAYFVSARAVLWIMKAEYSKIEGWKQWYDNKTPEAKVQVMLKNIVQARNRSLKQNPLKTRKYITLELGDGEFVDIKEKMRKFSGKKVELEIQAVKNKKRVVEETDSTLHMVGKININNTIKEFKNNDILEICKNYINWLEEIVEECEKKIG